MSPAQASSSSSSMPPSSSSNLNQGAYHSAPRVDDFDPEVASDIVDQYGSVLEHTSESLPQMPPRPDSRLAFHNNAVADGQDAGNAEQPPAFNIPPRSSRLEWTKSLFQKIGFRSSSSSAGSSAVNEGTIINEDVLSSSSPTTPSTRTTISHSISSTFDDTAADGVSVMIDDISFTFCSSDEETDSSDGDSEIDVDVLDDLDTQDPDSLPIIISEDFSSASSSSAEPIMFAPRASRASSSSSSLLEDADMDLPVKPKYSCLPSLFSPRPRPPRSLIVSPQPQRHAYEHHGHSRHSLIHTKWFWAMREEEWTEYAVCVQHIPAYGGIEPTSPEIPLAERFPSLFASARDTPSPSTQTSPPSTPPMPPMSIHPRWGDLSGLRDSWCTHMDRYFVDIPLWRIRKSLWTADMEVLVMVHLRMKAEDNEEPEPDSCATSSCGESMQMSMLTGYSDDSDLTLVDSDNEEEVGTHDSNVSESSSVGTGKAAFDSEGDEEFFEDVNLHGPTASSSSSSAYQYGCAASSSTSTFAHTTPKPFTLEGHFQSTSPLQTPFCPPYSPQCPYSLKQLGHPWATCWYQRSQLLLQLWGLGQTTATTKSQGKAPMVGLGLDVGLEKKRHSHNVSDFGVDDEGTHLHFERPLRLASSLNPCTIPS